MLHLKTVAYEFPEGFNFRALIFGKETKKYFMLKHSTIDMSRSIEVSKEMIAIVFKIPFLILLSKTDVVAFFKDKSEGKFNSL